MKQAEVQHSRAQNPAPVRQEKSTAGIESPQGEQIAQLEAMMDSSPQAAKLAQLAAVMNAGPAMAEQRRLSEMIHNSPNLAAQRKFAEGINSSPGVTARQQKVENHFGETAQRHEADGKEAGAMPDPASSTMQGRLLSDDADTPARISKDRFLAELRIAVEIAARNILEPVGLAQKDCPDLSYWIAYYQDKSAAYTEHAIIRYAPAAAGAQDWREMLAALMRRVEQGLREHVATGINTVDPEEAPSSLEESRPVLQELPVQRQIAPVQMRLGKKRDGNKEEPKGLIERGKPRRVDIRDNSDEKKEDGEGLKERKKFELTDIKKNSETKKSSMMDVLPGEVFRGSLESEALVNVVSDLSKGGMFEEDKDRVYFNNYFSAKTWVMADVFKGPDLANFTMNEAIEEQALIAGVKLTGLQQVVIKNVVNEQTKTFIQQNGFKHGDQMSEEQLVKFLTGTPLGKGTCWTVCSDKNARVPVAAQVLLDDGMVIIIRLEALSDENRDFMNRVNPYLTKK